LSLSSAQSQVYETKWGLSIGGTYPRFFSISGEGYARNTNYGGYISAERYFNENISLRFLINLIYMESNYSAGGIGKVQSVNHLAGNLDVIYKFIPCRMISPYIVFGLGSTVFKSDNSFSQDLDDKTVWGYQANFGLGIEWGISKSLSLKTEAVYRTASNNKIDGNKGINENYKGVLGGNGDTYATFDLGVIWYFSKGDKSKLCDRCPQGITEIVKTDTIIIKEPIEIVQLDTIQIEKPILIGVHFDFDKYDLRPESYPVLNHAVEILKKFSDIEVKIDGHTDSFGTNDYNIQLSERRVNTVYNYLVSKGISGDRIYKNWYGEERPLKDNDNPINRAFNRRVEIKVLN
jgi:OOP family OmpA-OmpF porin